MRVDNGLLIRGQVVFPTVHSMNSAGLGEHKVARVHRDWRCASVIQDLVLHRVKVYQLGGLVVEADTAQFRDVLALCRIVVRLQQQAVLFRSSAVKRLNNA